MAPDTAILPTGWEARLVPVRNANTRGATGWCLEVHDSCSRRWLPDELLRRLPMPIEAAVRELLAQRIQQLPSS